ncbi:MAG: transposase [Actinomycetota bacterium]
MTLGLADRQGGLFDDVNRFCDEALPEGSVYAVLHRERDRLFPDGLFADLFSDRGRRSVPPSVVATVMVLQRLEGLSDREAVERYTFDARWRFAAGVGGYGSGGWGCFAHTVLVDMRARLDASDDPRRIFKVTVEAASAAGLVGARRVLDSTPLYDAVATMDTITLIRSAIRALLRVAGVELEAELGAVLGSGDDYASSAKPHIDWDDSEARDALIDSRAKDAFACLTVLDGRVLNAEVAEAAELVATVVGQDLEGTDDGTFRIARRVAKDRVISTVDSDARHGHKTSARGFDGYKGHVAVDPDSEIITDTVVTPGNAGDASVAADLIDDLLGEEGEAVDETTPVRSDMQANDGEADRPTVYGDAAYGTGEFLDHLAEGGIDSRAKDAFACLAMLDGRELSAEVAEAAELVATVVGQDLEGTEDGTFRIARRVAKDRVISTVDSDARHGHKTSARGFDGYKAHVAVDPDSEIITDTAVTPGNAGDASVAADLIDDLVGEEDEAVDETTPARSDVQANDGEADRPTVYGDAAYGTGEFLDYLAEQDIDSRCKTQPPTAPGGLFAKDRFDIDLEADTVTCPNHVTVKTRRGSDGDGIAYFADACAECPLRAQCTNAQGGRTIRVGRYEQRLADARRQQQDPEWAADYRGTRPKVERKLGHMMRRRHGGRRARVRGKHKVDADFNLLAAAQNLARLSVLGLHFTVATGWAAAT